jgi:hypothetical protein
VEKCRGTGKRKSKEALAKIILNSGLTDILPEIA